jgi:cation transport ATPase
MALLTGESEPTTVRPGDRVVAGAPLVDGAVTVEVERVGEETLGRQMAAAVRSSVDRGLPPTPADRIAPWFTAATLIAAVTAFVAWSASSGIGTGLQVMVAVLVVACPCALGLSWPTAVSAGLASLARRGLVLRSGDALLRLAEVDVVALDKTGTVTGGTPTVVSADDAVLRVAAGLERASAHPVARAIRDEATRRGLPLPLADDVRERAGVGVSGVVDGERWSLSAGGPGEVRLEGEDGLVGLIRLRDVRRVDAAGAVASLTALVSRVALLTGDHDDVAARLGAEVGVDEIEARMRPDDKAAWIRARQAEGHTVLLVGDGLNDGPALVAADVGLAMRAGAPSSVLAADGVVAEEALGPVVAALRGARVVRDVVRANLVRSLVYNVVAVSLALAGVINPLVAAVLMPLSSAMVWLGGYSVERRLAAEEAKWTSS